MEGFFRLEHWRVRVDNREDDRVIWKRGEFVLVVPVTEDDQVVLIREYKQAVEQVLLCLPAGGKKKDETPQAAALRELREETGCVGEEGNCRVFGPFFNSPDKSTEKHFVVVVTGVKNGGTPTPEEAETILGSQLSPRGETKEKLLVGLHRMALDVANDALSKSFAGIHPGG
ncbi:MAG: NUDIX hydrolase [Candidatus Moranbacteria bacterium]|nr:NUDIX hydrolase [Candidatus Moranbacteria bacterium]